MSLYVQSFFTLYTKLLLGVLHLPHLAGLSTPRNNFIFSNNKCNIYSHVYSYRIYTHMHTLCLTLSLRALFSQSIMSWILASNHKYRIYTPYMTVCMLISLPKMSYIHRVYTYKCMVMANPTNN